MLLADQALVSPIMGVVVLSFLVDYAVGTKCWFHIEGESISFTGLARELESGETSKIRDWVVTNFSSGFKFEEYGLQEISSQTLELWWWPLCSQYSKVDNFARLRSNHLKQIEILYFFNFRAT